MDSPGLEVQAGYSGKVTFSCGGSCRRRGEEVPVRRSSPLAGEVSESANW